MATPCTVCWLSFTSWVAPRLVSMTTCSSTQHRSHSASSFYSILYPIFTLQVLHVLRDSCKRFLSSLAVAMDEQVQYRVVKDHCQEIALPSLCILAVLLFNAAKMKNQKNILFIKYDFKGTVSRKLSPMLRYIVGKLSL